MSAILALAMGVNDLARKSDVVVCIATAPSQWCDERIATNSEGCHGPLLGGLYFAERGI